MQTVTKTFEVYDFAELSDRAQDNVRNMFAKWLAEDSFWYEFMISEWEGRLGNLGFEDAKIAFSGFWSQGDGASFIATVNLAHWLQCNPQARKEYPAATWQIDRGHITYARITRYGRYAHEGTMSIDVTPWEATTMRGREEFEKLADEILQNAKDLAHEIYRSLEDEYEYQTSDEALIELCEANEYCFTEDGKLYY